jgi:hypothetical protein
MRCPHIASRSTPQVKAAHDRTDPTAVAAALCRRTRHRSHQDDHRMDRDYLAHRPGDAINAVLAAAGYNFRRLLAWLRLLLRVDLYILAPSDQRA